MASINKLSIRGVRAFSPDDQEQVIEFYFPVTIIVGANGCGKTTIIESLKYAVTGSLPPGNKSGQAFVHDPKSVGQSIVKANIKLRFTNRAGTSMVVVRSMELTQKKTALTFKALDGILRTVDPNTGERITMSHKCTELDRQIPMLLGVSKPILEHVVFCHQEDSSWPLMEGAVLKKRFDDIFDSTRYAKALEAIRKTKTEYTIVVKDLKAELNGLASHKHAAKGFRQELDQHHSTMEQLDHDMAECSSQIKEADEEMKRNKAIIDKIEDLQADIDERKSDLDREQSVLAKQQSMLEEDMTETHSARELKEILRGFDEQNSRQLELKSDMQRDCQRLRSDMESIRQEDLILRGQIGKLAAEEEAYEQLVKRRLVKMEQIATAYGIQLPITQTQNASMFTGTQSSVSSETVGVDATQDSIVSVSNEDMEAFHKALDKKETECKDELRRHKQQTQKDEDESQGVLGDLVAKQMAIEHDRNKMLEEIQDARRELSLLNSQGPTLSRIRKGDIEEAKRQAAKFAKEREELNNSPDLKNIPTKIRSIQGKIDKLTREIEDDQQALRDLRHNSEAQNAVTVLREQTVKELENLRDLLNEQSYALQKFHLQAPIHLPGIDGGDTNGDELVDAMETLAEKVRDKNETLQLELTKAKDDQARKQHMVSEKSALVSHNQQSLASLRSKIAVLGGDNGTVGKFHRIIAAIKQFEIGAGMPSTMDSSDPQRVLSYLTSRMEDIETNSMEGVQPEIVSKVLDQLKSLATIRGENGAALKQVCPCCRRDLDEVEEVLAFKRSLDQLKDVETSPLLQIDKAKSERSRAAKANYQRWRKVISDSMQDVMDYNRMSTELNDVQHKLSDLEEDLGINASELDELKSRTSELQSEADELRELVETTRRWVEDANRVAGKKAQIDTKQLELSHSVFDAGGKDIKTVEEDLSKHLAEKDSCMNEIAKLNKDMTTLNNRISQLATQATRLELNAKEKEAKYAEEQEASIRKTQLNEDINRLGDLEKKLQDQLAPLRQKVRAKESEKTRMRAAAKDEEDRLSETLSAFLGDVNELRGLTSQIISYMQTNKAQDLEHLNNKILALVERMQGKAVELKALEPELDRVTRSINDQERYKKLIKDNIDVIAASHGIQELRKDLTSLKEAMEQIDGHDSCSINYDNASLRMKGLMEHKARHEGRRGGLLDQIRSLKRKLKTPEYKDIDERYRQVMIKHETTQIAVSDLEKYHKALDKALLRYHGIKIEEINKIIRELWTLTYKGEDINSIELVSGQESGSKAARSYNYRVVMTKGSTQMDMRGRCSAGQRVLASIVIRLALAETFCVNCGCIALDEPTVNLDHNNKRGLAIALAQIIATRAHQSNFQLVIITHDEDFVGMMKTELSTQTGFEMPEKYFQVRREEGTDGKHYSKIDAVDWDELL